MFLPIYQILQLLLELFQSHLPSNFSKPKLYQETLSYASTDLYFLLSPSQLSLCALYQMIQDKVTQEQFWITIGQLNLENPFQMQQSFERSLQMVNSKKIPDRQQMKKANQKFNKFEQFSLKLKNRNDFKKKHI